MAATVAVETSGPKPGICRSCWQRASSLTMRSISSVIAAMSISSLLPLLPQSVQQPAQTRAQIRFGIFDHSRQVLAQVDGLGREGDDRVPAGIRESG